MYAQCGLIVDPISGLPELPQSLQIEVDLRFDLILSMGRPGISDTDHILLVVCVRLVDKELSVRRAV